MCNLFTKHNTEPKVGMVVAESPPEIYLEQNNAEKIFVWNNVADNLHADVKKLRRRNLVILLRRTQSWAAIVTSLHQKSKIALCHKLTPLRMIYKLWRKWVGCDSKLLTRRLFPFVHKVLQTWHQGYQQGSKFLTQFWFYKRNLMTSTLPLSNKNNNKIDCSAQNWADYFLINNIKKNSWWCYVFDLDVPW